MEAWGKAGLLLSGVTLREVRDVPREGRFDDRERLLGVSVSHVAGGDVEGERRTKGPEVVDGRRDRRVQVERASKLQNSRAAVSPHSSVQPRSERWARTATEVRYAQHLAAFALSYPPPPNNSVFFPHPSTLRTTSPIPARSKFHSLHGSPARPSHPHCMTTASGPYAIAAGSTHVSKTRRREGEEKPGSRARLRAWKEEGEFGGPVEESEPVDGKKPGPWRCREMVKTWGVEEKASSTPSPW